MKKTRQWLFVIGIQVFMCLCASLLWAAEGKIGLDLEWRPIKGVQEPVTPNKEPAEQRVSGDKTWSDPVTGMAFVWVPKGCFQMGCGSWAGNCYKNEKPVHEVCLDGFWMGKHEVTIGDYRKFLQDGGDCSGVDWSDSDCPLRKGGSYALSKNKFGSSNKQPMVEVSWNGAKAFAEWLSRKTGKRFRLPTEAEWEFACRSGGKPEKYAGGSNVDRVAWYTKNSGGRTHEVGTREPNGLGIHDMSGNVWEWCGDIYEKSAYSKHKRNNPIYDDGGSYRVLRGGSWSFLPRYVRCGYRVFPLPGSTAGRVGFRLVRTR